MPKQKLELPNDLLQQYPKETCETCSTHHVFYLERINPGLVTILRKFALGVAARRNNCIHPERDLEGTAHQMTHNELSNLYKLRMHGILVPADEKYVINKRPDAPRNKDGSVYHTGYWLMTRRAGMFLRGEAVPRAVVILHSHKVADYPDAGTCTIRDFEMEPLEQEYWDKIDWYTGQGRLV